MCIRSINPCSSELLECKHEVLFAPIHNLQKKLSHLSVLLLFWGHKSTLTTVLHPSFILSGTEIYSLTSTEVLSHFNIPYLLGNSKERGIKFSSRKVSDKKLSNISSTFYTSPLNYSKYIHSTQRRSP